MAQLRDMCFKRTDLGTIEKHLNSDSMKLLQHFDGRTPFHQIQQMVGLPAAVFKSSFLELFQKKLIEEVHDPLTTSAGPVSFVNTSVLDKLRMAAIQVAGPIGELLVSDCIENMGLQPSKIPVSRLPELIQAISEDIPGEKQRSMFLGQLPPDLRFP